MKFIHFPSRCTAMRHFRTAIKFTESKMKEARKNPRQKLLLCFSFTEIHTWIQRHLFP